MEREERKIYLNDLKGKMKGVMDLAYEIMDGPYGVLPEIEEAATRMYWAAHSIYSKQLSLRPRNLEKLLEKIGSEVY